MEYEINKELAEQIFTDYSTYVYRTALLLTKSSSMADDILQETFDKVFKKFSTFDSSKPLKPWIYKITVNTARNLLRKQKWLSFLSNVPEVSDGSSVESNILKSEEFSELIKEIDRLSLKNKEIIILHFYAELKLNEIAESLNIPLGTCKSRLNSALTQLRKQLPKNELFKFHDRRMNHESI